MSNVNYAKENVILEAVRSILVADNGTLSSDVKSIHQYVADRIIRKKAFLEPPEESLITMEVISRGGNYNLPSSSWFLTITAINPMEAEPIVAGSNAQDDVANMSQRIEYLLNKKHDDLNNSVPTKNLRCRLINRISLLPTDDEKLKLYKRDIVFEMITDDEILDCN